MIVKQKIIFFFNNLERTGAEIFLFNLVDSLDLTRFEITIVSIHKAGQLKDELNPEIHLIDDFIRFRLFNKILCKFGIYSLEVKIKHLLRLINPDICYFNTLDHLYLLKYIDKTKIKTIVHIHELSSNYSYITDSVFNGLLDVNQIIACSKLVYEELSTICKGKIDVVNSCPPEVLTQNRCDLSKKISNNIRIITSGSISFRKGTDIWLKIVQKVDLPNLEFIWLGKSLKNGYSRWIKLTSDKLNSKIKNFKFLEPHSKGEYDAILASGNYFLSTSREESMGIAMMEAQLCGLTIIALNSGGSELIIRPTDYLIETFDVDEIVLQLSNILNKKITTIDKSCKYNFDEEFQKWLKILN